MGGDTAMRREDAPVLSVEMQTSWFAAADEGSARPDVELGAVEDEPRQT